MEDSLTYIAKEAIYVLIYASAPILLISLLVGLLIALFQALTQIQEATLTFVPKTLAIYVSLIFFGPYMLSKLNHLVELISDAIIQVQ